MQLWSHGVLLAKSYNACMHACMHINTYIHTYIHACIHTYIHTDMHAYIHTHIHTMHTYIHAYIHTYIHTQCIHSRATLRTLSLKPFNNSKPSTLKPPANKLRLLQQNMAMMQRVLSHGRPS